MSLLSRVEHWQVRRLYARMAFDPSAAGPDLTQPAGTDCLPEIRHILVLMMENHSFDSYFASLAPSAGLALDVNSRPAAVNVGLDGTAVWSHHLPPDGQIKAVPSASWHASHLQFNRGRNDGFVSSAELQYPERNYGQGMAYWDERDIPFYYSLARTFTLATSWFSSCLGPTFPNRRFLVAGTALGLIDDLPFGTWRYPPNGTIFDLLDYHTITWKNYHHSSRSVALAKRVAGPRTLQAARWLGMQVVKRLAFPLPFLLDRLRFTADLYPMGLLRTIRHTASIDRFFVDAASGELPCVSFIDPDFNSTSEENPQDIRKGQAFAARIVNSVIQGPAWPHTLLIWLYDEHGGYYDSVPPPPAPAPDDVRPHSVLQDTPGWLKAVMRRVAGNLYRQLEAADQDAGSYDQFGFRVPAVIVSPYAKPGHVSSCQYDHTSILKLIASKWNLPPLTQRDAAATSPSADCLDLSRPALLTVPRLAEPQT